MRIAVIGSNGQVGSEVVRAAQAAGVETLEFEHADIEVTDQAERRTRPIICAGGRRCREYGGISPHRRVRGQTRSCAVG